MRSGLFPYPLLFRSPSPVGQNRSFSSLGRLYQTSCTSGRSEVHSVGVMRILRRLRSRALPCGCLVGVYETYADQTVAIVDAKGPDREHRVDSGIGLQMVDILP